MKIILWQVSQFQIVFLRLIARFYSRIQKVCLTSKYCIIHVLGIYMV